MKTKCYIFDMDWTLALKWDRGIHDYQKVNLDTPNYAIVQLANDLQTMYPIVISTGRRDCLELTQEWLNNNWIKVERIYMRTSWDYRWDDIVKKELLDEIQKEYEIIAWFDDRDRVVKMLRENGVTVCQVNYWNF